MKSNSIILSLILSCLFQFSIAQTAETKESLEAALDTYIEVTEAMDFAKIMDYMPPKFFEKFPKEQMMKVMEQSFNNPNVKLNMDSFRIVHIHPFLEIEQGKYTLVDYAFRMHMQMTEPLEEGETEEDKKEQMGFMKSMLEMQHGEGSVLLEEESSTFIINVETTMYAISEPEYEGWKFIEKKEKVPGLLDSILPKEAIEGLK